MAAELVNAATSEKLAEIDWTKNIEISELVARDQRYSIVISLCLSISLHIVLFLFNWSLINAPKVKHDETKLNFFFIFNSYLLGFFVWALNVVLSYFLDLGIIPMFFT